MRTATSVLLVRPRRDLQAGTHGQRFVSHLCGARQAPFAGRAAVFSLVPLDLQHPPSRWTECPVHDGDISRERRSDEDRHRVECAEVNARLLVAMNSITPRVEAGPPLSDGGCIMRSDRRVGGVSDLGCSGAMLRSTGPALPSNTSWTDRFGAATSQCGSGSYDLEVTNHSSPVTSHQSPVSSHQFPESRIPSPESRSVSSLPVE